MITNFNGFKERNNKFETKTLNNIEVPRGLLYYISDYISEYGNMDLFNSFILDNNITTQEELDTILLNEWLIDFWHRHLENEE